ncbi:MAG TPA: type II 3-dehydroquinate dehydratase [Steroidobacteraceae bacterium]
MSNRVYLLNGPNLDLLGEREPQLYGRTTLAEIEALCRTAAAPHGLDLVCHQTNAEHEMIAWLHEARRAAGIVMNPAAFCYHSVPILDALRLCECPIVEVHISNIYRRDETWRSQSLLAAACSGVITGLGVEGYRLAIEYLARQIAPRASGP